MKRFSCSAVLLIAGLLLTGCGNVFDKGSSASPPTDVTVTPGDGAVTVTWTMTPNVQYWVFYAPASFISEDNWTSIPGSRALINVSSPTVVTGLTNGTTYSFMVNGRIDNGPGGAASPSLSAVPRLAGATWTAGAPLCGGTCILQGVTRGAVYVAVGDQGSMFSSADGALWTPLANPAPTADLRAVTYGGNYVAVGAGGITLFSADAATWIQSGHTGNDLTAVAGNGAGTYVAVGSGGTILFSNDGQNWTPANSIPVSTDLYGVTYGTVNGNAMWSAVGDGGTLLTSSDASNWSTASSNTGSPLKGITFGANLFVAVGDNGTIISSPDAVNWTPTTSTIGPSLNAVTYGRQWVAVGASGAVFTSTDGNTWQSQTSGTSSDLNSIAHAATGYSAVGANGVNLTAN